VPMPTSGRWLLERLGLATPVRGPVPRMACDNKAFHYPLPPYQVVPAALRPAVTDAAGDYAPTVVESAS